MWAECCRDAANLASWAGGRDNLVRCRICGLAWQRPQPSDQRLAEIYGPGYYASWGNRREAYWGLKLALAGRVLAGLGALPPGARVLDVGCATGAFLEAIRERGWQASGVDFNPWAVAQARQHVPEAEVHVGGLDALPPGRGRFAAAIFSDVLEHVRDPVAELLRVREFLVPGGKLAVLAPDADSLSARLMRGQWMHVKPEHLFYYTRRSLANLFTHCGFTQLSARRLSKPVSLEYALSQADVYPAPLLGPALRMLCRLAPARMRRATFPLPLGEMLVVAEKRGDAAGIEAAKGSGAEPGEC